MGYFELGYEPFDFALPNELLVTMGTDALDWLPGGRDSVAFDWFLGARMNGNYLDLLRQTRCHSKCF